MLPARLAADAAELYDRYHRIVHCYLLRLSGSPETAEELLQETFYNAMRGAASYRGDAAPSTWLCAIARRLWLNHCVRQGRQESRRSDAAWDRLAAVEPGPEAMALNGEMRSRIDAILAELPEMQRLALLLRDADGLPYETVAQMLGISLANAKVTIHRARQHFRARYTEHKE